MRWLGAAVVLAAATSTQTLAVVLKHNELQPAQNMSALGKSSNNTNYKRELENAEAQAARAEARAAKWERREERLQRILHKTRDWVYNRGYATLPSWSDWILQVTISWVIFMLLCLIVWMNYYPEDPDLDEMFADKEKADPVKTFNEGHFGCLETPRICLFACFCPALRWADNVNMANFMKLPVALGLFFLCALANGLTGTFCYFGIVTCFMMLYYRHKLRAKLGLPSWTCRSCFTDFFFVFCCSWCAIAQEARVVRYAYQQGTLSLATGKRYEKSALPGRPFPRVGCDAAVLSQHVLQPPPEPAPLAAQRLVADA